MYEICMSHTLSLAMGLFQIYFIIFSYCCTYFHSVWSKNVHIMGILNSNRKDVQGFYFGVMKPKCVEYPIWETITTQLMAARRAPAKLICLIHVSNLIFFFNFFFIGIGTHDYFCWRPIFPITTFLNPFS